MNFMVGRMIILDIFSSFDRQRAIVPTGSGHEALDDEAFHLDCHDPTLPFNVNERSEGDRAAWAAPFGILGDTPVPRIP